MPRTLRTETPGTGGFVTRRLQLGSVLLLSALACQGGNRDAASPPLPSQDAAPEAEPADSALDSTRAGAEPYTPDDPAPSEAPASTDFELVPLPIPGHLDAVVALPLDPRPRPLLIATHGAGGDPAWTCRAWGRRVAARHLVLCPRGHAISLREDHGFYYPDHRALTAEVLAAVSALREAHAARLSSEPAVYTGYSQGASMGSLGLVEHAADYPRLVLTEGGFREWSGKSARTFAKNGGKRVLFVCGGRGCQASAEKSAGLLRAAGVEARVDYVPNGGHTDGGAVGEHLDRAYGWVLEAPED